MGKGKGVIVKIEGREEERAGKVPGQEERLVFLVK
jgi:hypothetical protein